MSDPLEWKKYTIAEDELSKLEGRRAQIETTEQFEAAATEPAQPDFFAHVQILADQCDAILRSKDYPGAAERIWLHPDGEWHRQEKEDRRLSPWSLRPAALWIQGSATDFSEVWYAARIGWACRLFLGHIKIGNSAKPHVHALAYEIGVLKNDANWRLQHKPSVLTGDKQRRALTKRREERNTRAAILVRKRRDIIATLMGKTQRTGGALDKWLVQQLIERHSMQVSARTVRGDRKAIRG